MIVKESEVVGRAWAGVEKIEEDRGETWVIRGETSPKAEPGRLLRVANFFIIILLVIK